MHKIIKNNRGSTLVMVLIILVVLTILGTSLLTLALANTNNTIHQENSMKAYFIARSGAMTLAEHIVDNPSIDVEGMISAGPTSAREIADGTFQVEVGEEDGELIISSTGVVNDVSQNVEVVLEKSAGQILDFTVLAKGKISIANHVSVVGNIATNAKSISDVSTSPHANPKAEDVILDAGVAIPEISWPSSFNQVFNHKITGDELIQVSGDTYVHLAKGVGLSNKSTLSAIGSGTLHLYVSNGWTSDNHTAFVSDPDVKVIIYAKDGYGFYIRSHMFKGVIYAPDSSVTFHNASGSAHGGRNFHGSIIANNVYLDGNHTVLEENPDYDPDDLTLNHVYRIKETR